MPTSLWVNPTDFNTGTQIGGSDTSDVCLGTKFSSTAAGNITGIVFRIASDETSTNR